MRLKKIKNYNRYRTANESYYHAKLTFESGTSHDFLFTTSELRRAKDRATKNPEDRPRKWWKFW